MHFSPDSKRLWGFESRDFSEEESDQDHYRDFIDQHGYDYIAATHGERSEFYYIPQPSQLPERLHHTKWMGDKTLEFLDRRDSSRPFFCWTSFINPHPPFESPVPWNRLYRMIEMNLPDGRTYIGDLINQVPHGNGKFIVRGSGVVQGQFN